MLRNWGAGLLNSNTTRNGQPETYDTLHAASVKKKKRPDICDFCWSPMRPNCPLSFAKKCPPFLGGFSYLSIYKLALTWDFLLEEARISLAEVTNLGLWHLSIIPPRDPCSPRVTFFRILVTYQIPFSFILIYFVRLECSVKIRKTSCQFSGCDIHRSIFTIILLSFPC